MKRSRCLTRSESIQWNLQNILFSQREEVSSAGILSAIHSLTVLRFKNCQVLMMCCTGGAFVNLFESWKVVQCRNREG